MGDSSISLPYCEDGQQGQPSLVSAAALGWTSSSEGSHCLEPHPGTVGHPQLSAGARCHGDSRWDISPFKSSSCFGAALTLVWEQARSYLCRDMRFVSKPNSNSNIGLTRQEMFSPFSVSTQAPQTKPSLVSRAREASRTGLLAPRGQPSQ